MHTDDHIHLHAMVCATVPWVLCELSYSLGVMSIEVLGDAETKISVRVSFQYAHIRAC